MNRKILKVFISLLILLLFTGCGFNVDNKINNEVYDVEIDINEIDQAFVPAIEIASESTLGITVYNKKSYAKDWEAISVGSCVIYEGTAITKDGDKINIKDSYTRDDINTYKYKAVTNAHVVEGGKGSNKYVIYDGDTDSSWELDILGKDTDIDLAVVSFESPVLYIPITFADSDLVKKGQIVLAVGNSNGYEYYSSATMGIISYPKRYTEESGYAMEYIQHDAAINPGNSGGALVNIKGELVGINTSKIVEDDVDSMGFAIPVNTVKKVLNRLENGEVINKSSQLFDGDTITSLKLNAFLNAVDNNFGSLDYGYKLSHVPRYSIFYSYFKIDDIVLEVNNQKIYNELFFKHSLMLCESGDKVKINLIRNNELVVFDIEF